LLCLFLFCFVFFFHFGRFQAETRRSSPRLSVGSHAETPVAEVLPESKEVLQAEKKRAIGGEEEETPSDRKLKRVQIVDPSAPVGRSPEVARRSPPPLRSPSPVRAVMPEELLSSQEGGSGRKTRYQVAATFTELSRTGTTTIHGFRESSPMLKKAAKTNASRQLLLSSKNEPQTPEAKKGAELLQALKDRFRTVKTQDKKQDAATHFWHGQGIPK
jgi:hypothetical protein